MVEVPADLCRMDDLEAGTVSDPAMATVSDPAMAKVSLGVGVGVAGAGAVWQWTALHPRCSALEPAARRFQAPPLAQPSFLGASPQTPPLQAG